LSLLFRNSFCPYVTKYRGCLTAQPWIRHKAEKSWVCTLDFLQTFTYSPVSHGSSILASFPLAAGVIVGLLSHKHVGRPALLDCAGTAARGGKRSHVRKLFVPLRGAPGLWCERWSVQKVGGRETDCVEKRSRTEKQIDKPRWYEKLILVAHFPSTVDRC